MPTLSVFFRKEDVAKWKAIDQKSEWLHKHLDSTSSISNSITTYDVTTDTTISNSSTSPVHDITNVKRAFPGAKLVKPKASPPPTSYKETTNWGA